MKLRYCLSFLLFAICVPSALAQIPIVYDATVDTKANTLTITGINFGQSPTVTLGGVLPLNVHSGATSTQIVADLPASLAPGSYLVFTKFSNFTVAVFEATIGAVGPRGPAGPVGPAGPSGANGISVAVVALPVGDAHCPTGGALVSGAYGNSYVCNGAQGPPGAAGSNGTFGTQILIFTKNSPTSFTVPNGVNSVIVEAWGGGGGGYLQAVVPVNAGETLTLTIGAGGSGTNIGTANGGDGGNTTLNRGATTLLSIGGGQGGQGGSLPQPGSGGYVRLFDPTVTILQALVGGDAVAIVGGFAPEQGLVGAGAFVPGTTFSSVNGLVPPVGTGNDGLMIIHLSSTM
jgi:hypothetical protein